MSQPSESTTGLDAAFLARQKARLEALRDRLVAEADAAGSDERRLQDESIDEVRDSADSAETMAMQENDEATYRRNIERLKAIRRALEKIAQGTYGLSDISGEPIARARLEALPEALDSPSERDVT
ncbi:TraR/DksA family transcriptional regulator [Dyella ginsengisoli]|uniref:TraR/DksA family transcriptional regulator n=1 Tax=Dyella ginsengisoli TaxID=363848 RepID=A0ABW8JU52_9GAMM